MNLNVEWMSDFGARRYQSPARSALINSTFNIQHSKFPILSPIRPDSPPARGCR
jgi:hypothetical protein